MKFSKIYNSWQGFEERKSVEPTIVQPPTRQYTYVCYNMYKKEHVHTVVVIWYGRQYWTRKLSFFDKLFTKCITSTGTNRRTEHFLGKYCKKTEFLGKKIEKFLNWKNVQEMKISFVVNPHCHHHQHIMLLNIFFYIQNSVVLFKYGKIKLESCQDYSRQVTPLGHPMCFISIHQDIENKRNFTSNAFRQPRNVSISLSCNSLCASYCCIYCFKGIFMYAKSKCISVGSMKNLIMYNLTATAVRCFGVKKFWRKLILETWGMSTDVTANIFKLDELGSLLTRNLFSCILFGFKLNSFRILPFDPQTDISISFYDALKYRP